MKEQSRLDTVWASKREWCRKAFTIVIAMVLLLCFTMLLSLIIGFIFQGSFSLIDNIVLGIDILCGYRYDNPEQLYALRECGATGMAIRFVLSVGICRMSSC